MSSQDHKETPIIEENDTTTETTTTTAGDQKMSTITTTQVIETEPITSITQKEEETIKVIETEPITTITQKEETTKVIETENIETITEKESSAIDYSIVDALPPQPEKTEDVPEKKKSKKSKKDNEKADKEDNNEPDVPNVPFFGLFRFAEPLDKLLMLLGTLAAMGNGGGLPVMTVIFGNIIQSFGDFTLAIYTNNPPADQARETLHSEIRKNTLYFVALAATVFVLAYIQLSVWMIAGERQAKRIRNLYFGAILRQDISWFDSKSSGDLTTRISGDVSLLQEGISEKVGLIVQYLSTFIVGFIIAFVKGWKLALVLCCVFPLIAASGGLMAASIAAFSAKGQDAYANAGSIAVQVFSSIRTVVSFGGEPREIERYVAQLKKAYKIGRTKGLIQGFGIGSIFLLMFCTYALAFWYGSRLIVNGEQNGGQVLNVFFAIIIGAFSLGNASPHFGAIGSASGAAAKLFDVIDRVPGIDVTDESGEKLTKSEVKGRIEFRNVSFHYPQRPDVPVLKNFNLTIEPGQTVALVGSSGSGKSTIVQLMERFYDPISGSILLDGVDIKSINLKSLRSQIGLVGQEPVLFPSSMKQNIQWGAPTGKELSMDELIQACKASNAHDFIEDLPHKYDTLVGEKGALISGGQKQRIAIARALVKDPAILLLDEATSALDAEAEGIVQSALDNASTNRTTIVIAHRLSTIKHADKIIVMTKGEIIEVGTHDDLISRNGVYFGLVQAQELKTTSEKLSVTKDDDDDAASSTSGISDVAIDIGVKNRMLRKMSTKASTTKSVDEILKEQEEQNMKQRTPLGRVFVMSAPEWWLIILGVIGASVNGVIMPLFGLVFGTILSIFQRTDEPDKLKHDADFWACMFVALAVVAFVGQVMQIGSFSVSGERLTKRLRHLTFMALLKQEIAFYDDENNSTGALASKLATDASKVEGLTGALMGTIVSTFASLVAALIIGFTHGWKMTLVTAVATPILGFAAYLEMRTMAGFGSKTRKAYENAGDLVQQSVSNMRTIASLGLEETFIVLYGDSLAAPHKIAVRGIAVASIGFAASQSLQFCVWALAFWYGGQLVADLEYTVQQMMIVLFSVIFAGMALGQMSVFAPSAAKAKVGAITIFQILDRTSSIDPTDTEGKERPTPIAGEASIDDAEFTYPARQNVQILRGLDVKIRPGKQVALVGPSGCGKSTVVSLLLRFYDVDSGQISVERSNVKNWNLEYMRSNMALVGQEPVLFDMTIGENIAYGKEGCSQKEIEAAARGANIHNFVTSLPQGYNTPVGEKGTQLSGGQKQRVAIARALIRAPKILLLDEATSALDSESEKVVQDALDRASLNRTTVTIAHRLSTIQNADLILVIKKGKVVEQGKHMELIQQRGIYWGLVNRQILIKKEG